MHPIALIILYVALALTPLALAAGIGVRESDSLRELATGLGLVAFAMLLMQFVSSGRYEHLSGTAGIDRTMRFHQLAARAVMFLVILHVLLFFVPTSAQEIPQSARLLAQTLVAQPMLSGSIALAATILVVVTSVWRHRIALKYEIWRAGHALGSVLIAIAGGHHALSAGTYGESVWLRAFWWGMLALALGALGHVYLIKPWLIARSAYRVATIREAGHRIWEITMEPAKGRAIGFIAGQFAWVNFREIPNPICDNPFSISSSPAELPRMRFLIKARGDWTSRIGQVAPGTTVYIDAPHGNFTLKGRKGDALYLIAGGIGIAPIIGILRDLAAKRDRRPVCVLFGARNPQQLVHADEIAALRDVLDLKVSFRVDEPPPGWNGGVGEIDAAAIRDNLPAEPERCLCLICGPTPMMLSVERNLLDAGVPPGQIVYERFEYD